jgi:WD40 repeat protein
VNNKQTNNNKPRNTTMNTDTNKPSFHLARVSGGEELYEQTEIIMLNDAPPGAAMSRRDFLGTGITAAAALVLLGGCGRINARSMLCAHRGYVNSVCVSPDGNLLASGGEDNTIKLWSLPDRALLKTLKGHANDVTSVCISPDGKLLASGSYDETIKLWSLLNGDLLKTLRHGDWVNSVCISPDGKLLVSASSGTIKLWSLPDGALLKTLERSGWAKPICISPDGKLLVLAGNEGTLFLWSLSEWALLQTVHDAAAAPATSDVKPAWGWSSRVESVCISPDGKLLVSGYWNNTTIKLWSMPEGDLLKTLEERASREPVRRYHPEGVLLKTLKGHTGGVCSVCVSPDGKLLASGSWDDTIKLWSLPDGVLLKTVKGHAGAVTSVCISPDGKLLASGSKDKTIKLWSLPEGALLKTVEPPVESSIHSFTPVCISPDGKLLASGSWNYNICLWSIPDGKYISRLVDMAISPTP